MNIKRLVSIIFVVLLCVLALAIGSENSQIVVVNLLFVAVKLPLAVLLFSFFIFGVVFTNLLLMFTKFKKK